MPRKNFYISEIDDKEVYQKAKAIAGDSISSVIVEGLREYVRKKESLAIEMQPIIIYVGKTDYYPDGKVEKGKNLKFVGKMISDLKYDGISESSNDICTFRHILYLTVKGNYLYWHCEFNKTQGVETCNYHVFRSLSELINHGCPETLVVNALKAIPETEYEELDI